MVVTIISYESVYVKENWNYKREHEAPLQIDFTLSHPEAYHVTIPDFPRFVCLCSYVFPAYLHFLPFHTHEIREA